MRILLAAAATLALLTTLLPGTAASGSNAAATLPIDCDYGSTDIVHCTFDDCFLGLVGASGAIIVHRGLQPGESPVGASLTCVAAPFDLPSGSA